MLRTRVRLPPGPPKGYYMTPREEKLYWKGNYFSSHLTKSEWEEWQRIKNAHEKVPTDEEQRAWSIYFGIFFFLVLIAVL